MTIARSHLEMCNYNRFSLLGTVPGGRDVMTDQIVGLVNHITFHDLNLHDGNTIYATVEGETLQRFRNKFNGI